MIDITAWCKHYRDIGLNKTCKVGVAYHDVREASGDGPYKFPCFQEDGIASRCGQCVYPTEEEQAQMQEEVQQAALTFFQRLVGGICTVCGGEVTERRKIGRCVYAEPCGHRMYQGGLGE